MKNIPIGQHLIEKGLITEEQLQQVLAKQKESKGKMFGDVILEMKLVTENQFSEVLAERLNIPFVDLDKAVLIPDVVKRIPEDTARKYNCIALNKVGRRLTVATSEPSNFYAMEDLRVVTGCSINFSMATKGAVNRAIGKMYSAGQTDSIVEEATKQKEEEKSLEDLANEASNDRIDNAPIVKLASTIVADSFRKEATDIHIEPFRDFTKIRIRVNGDLIELMTLSSALHVALVTRFKILSGSRAPRTFLSSSCRTASPRYRRLVWDASWGNKTSSCQLSRTKYPWAFLKRYRSWLWSLLSRSGSPFPALAVRTAS